MAGRTSARSASTYRAPSPPKLRDRRIQSPVGRGTRATRSQSIELGNSDAMLNTRRSGRRTARQGSVDSVGSASSAGSKIGRRKKGSRVAVVEPELSMVTEDQEDIEPNDEDEDEVEVLEGQKRRQPGSSFSRRSPSLGAMSQFSGTTAMTSESSKEIAILDTTMIIEILPELYQRAYQVLDLLAPPNPSLEMVQSIVKELRILGSKRGKRLQHREKTFEIVAANYTSDIEKTKFPFINLSVILRKLLGPEPATGAFRPDAVVYAANLAFLTKSLLVLHKEGDDALRDLQLLENAFPAAFMSGFGNQEGLGSSDLRNESFALGLDLRTQILIAFLRHWRESPDDFDPDQILAGIFYNPSRRSVPVMDFDDTQQNGTLKDIAGISIDDPHFRTQIEAQVERIRATFNRSEEAIADKDFVDFEQLESAFPWSNFLTKAVQWSRSRLKEIVNCIELQGGVEAIKKLLVQIVNESDSQFEMSYVSPALIPGARQAEKQRASLLPSANITPASAGKSLYASKRSALLLQRLKTSDIHDLPPSNQDQQRATVKNNHSNSESPSHQRRTAAERVMEPAKTTNKIGQQAAGREAADHLDSMMDDNDITRVNEDNMPATAPYVAGYNALLQEKNKENRPINDGSAQTKVPRRWLDSQPNARRIEWDEGSQDSHPAPSSRKRAREETEESDAFEEDERPSPSRRKTAPLPRRMSPTPVPAPQSSKRARVDNLRNDDAEARTRARQRQDEMQPRVVHDEDDDIHMAFSQTFGLAARRMAGKARARNSAAKAPQRRTPWSDHDSYLLVKYIEKYNCSWSVIEKEGAKEEGFEVQRNQVALKDRARNMKVTFLKSGVTGDALPVNFEHVRLGKKELLSVQATLGNVDENGLELDE